MDSRIWQDTTAAHGFAVHAMKEQKLPMQSSGLGLGSGGTAHLEERDDVFKVIELEKVGLALGHDGQPRAQQHVGALLLQHHVDHAARNLGREGAAEARQEPLARVQHRQRHVLLQYRNYFWKLSSCSTGTQF